MIYEIQHRAAYEIHETAKWEMQHRAVHEIQHRSAHEILYNVHFMKYMGRMGNAAYGSS